MSPKVPTRPLDINTPYQYTLSMYPINMLSQYTLINTIINKPSTNINPHEIAENGEVEKEGEDDEDEDEEEDDGDADEEFFNALKEFEGKDIAALQAFIASHPLGD